MRNILLVTTFLFIFVSPIHSQEISEESTSSTIFSKKNISIAIISGVYLSTLIDSYTTWWKDDKQPFKFSDGTHWFGKSNAYGIDKLGHMYTSYFFYNTLKNLFVWGDFAPSTATWLSGTLTFGLAVLIEIGDGFSKYEFGFEDLTFNTIGLTYGILQDKIPFFQNINIKWSYFPTEGFTFPPKFSEHYDGHIYWLTFNIHNMFEKSLGIFWPEIIQPAVGYSVENMASQTEFIFGLDFNLLSLFKTKDENVKLISNTLNLFHIPPLPGVKFNPDTKPDYKMFIVN